MSPDPANAGADPTDPQTWNGYAYVRNSPLNAADPSGMSWQTTSVQVCTPVVSSSIDFTPSSYYNAPDGVTSACHFITQWVWVPDLVSGGGGNSGGGGGGLSQQPPKNDPKKIGWCLVKGAAVGAAGAAVVAGVVLAAPALGVSAAVVSTGLFVAGAIGGAATAVSTYQNIQNHNYAAVAFTVGSLGGGLAVGGLTGGALGDAINPPATRGFWSFGRDKANLFDPRKGLDLGKFMATGPDAAAAAGATGAAASSTSFLGRLLGGC